MSEIVKESQQLSQDSIINLYSIDLSKYGAGFQYFVSGAEVGDTSIVFDGVTYTPIDMSATGFEISGTGGLPTPTVRIVNRGFIQNLLKDYNDLIGCKFTRIRTYRKFLDDGDSPDSNAYYGPDIFIIEQKKAENVLFVEWDLSAAIDQEGKMLPGRQVIRDTCLWRYRVWDADSSSFIYTGVQCPYVGTNYFDIENNATTADKDVCSRRISGCKARFGDDAPLPFGGFPGVSRVRQ